MRELTREEKKKLQAMINRHNEEQEEKRQDYQVAHRRAVYQQRHAPGLQFGVRGRLHPHRSMYHIGLEQDMKQPGKKRQKSRRRSMKLKWMQLTRRQRDVLKDKVQETARKRHKT
jgi:hypothetical protein